MTVYDVKISGPQIERVAELMGEGESCSFFSFSSFPSCSPFLIAYFIRSSL
jgi:hypothetical protein